MQDPLASWAAIIAAIATFIIALLTFYNVRVARNSLKLMEQREKRLQPSLLLFHINSYMKRDKKNNSRIYAINVGITCNSDTDDSVRDLSMKIYFKRGSGATSNVILPTMRNVEKDDIDQVGVESNKILVVPIKIGAHEVVNGWGIFKIDDEIFSGSDIDNYQVILTDSQNIESYFEIKVMQEVA